MGLLNTTGINNGLETLVLLRKKYNINQRDLAEMLGTTQKSLSFWESTRSQISKQSFENYRNILLEKISPEDRQAYFYTSFADDLEDLAHINLEDLITMSRAGLLVEEERDKVNKTLEKFLPFKGAAGASLFPVDSGLSRLQSPESLIEEIVETLETILQSKDLELPPRQKAIAVSNLFKKFSEAELTSDQQTAEIIDLVEILKAS